MDRDRNLLFGVLAVQIKKVTPSQIMEAAGAWATDPSKDLPERLVEMGAVSEEDRLLFEGLVNKAVEVCGGDTAATLSAFGGEAQVHQSFRGSIVVSESGIVTKSGPPPAGAVLGDLESAPGVHENPGRYTKPSEYARGGMGRVLCVHDEYLGRDIALKELLPGLLGAPAGPRPSGTPSPVRVPVPIMARFLQEARITGQLEHPAIVPVYEVGYRKDGTPYYTMKLIKGNTLSTAIEEAGDLQERLKLLPHFVDLCQAIAYAHSRRVIHRDLKPLNVMVGEFGETVVLDWGLAKHKDDKEDVDPDAFAETLRPISQGDVPFPKTGPGRIIGTAAYMPPEQARGKLKLLDDRSDVYSLGAVLFEVLTGEPPFVGKTNSGILRQVKEEPLRSIRSLESGAPAELVSICKRAMAKGPARRYESAKEFAEEIERFQAGEPVQAHKYTYVERAGRYVRKHKAILRFSAAAFLILVGLVTLYVQSITAANLTIAASNRELTQTNEELQRRDYTSSIVLAGNYMEQGAVPEAVDLLLATPEALRNWEWGYLYGQAYRRVALTLVGHRADVTDASFSPDGRCIVTASRDTTAKVWDAATGEELLTLLGHAKGVRGASFSPDGKLIVTASWDKTARVWDAATGGELRVFGGDGGVVSSAGFSPDGKRIVTASADGTVKVWGAATGKEMLACSEWGSRGLSGESFSPDGKQIAVASANGTVTVWDAATGERLLTFSGHRGSVASVSFSPGGRHIVTASVDRTAKVWDAATGEELLTLAGHPDCLGSASFSPDAKRIVTASDDRTAKVWDAATGEELLTLSGHRGSVASASFSPDGRHVVTASTDGTAKVWIVVTGEEFPALARKDRWLRSPCFSADGRLAVDAFGGKMVTIQDAVNGEKLFTLAEHQSHVWSASFSPDGKRIVTASADKTARIWNVATGKTLLTLPGLPSGVFNAFFSPDGKLVFYRTKSTVATKIWDAGSGETALTFPSRSPGASGFSFSPDGKLIVTGSRDHTASVWDAETGAKLLTFQGSHDDLYSVGFSPDGRRIVTTSQDDTAKVWNVATGEELLVLSLPGSEMDGACFSPDGKRIATGSRVHTSSVWDAETGARLLTVVGRGTYGTAASFTPDGTCLVTGSMNPPETKVWEAAPWWPAAWHDEECRGVLIDVARRMPPTLEDRTGELSRASIRSQLQELKTFLQASGGETMSPSVLLVEGQGILFRDSWGNEDAPGLFFAKDEVLVRVNGIIAPTIEDVCALLEDVLRSFESEPSKYSRLSFELVNRCSHRILVLGSRR